MSLKEQTVVTGKVERYGNALVVPEGMPLMAAMEVLGKHIEYENTTVERSATFEGHPYDVAFAFGKAIEDVCGAVLGKPIQTFFGDEPPKEINVEVAPGEYVKVLWGHIVFPFDPKNGKFATGYERKSDGSVIGKCVGAFKQKYLPIWQEVVNKTYGYIATHSIFRGRTLRVRFLDNDGDHLAVPDIKPWDVRSVDISHLVFSRELEDGIADHILTPIRFREACEAAGTPFKRGILLAGPYGTGKTLLAASVAATAASKGMTVIYTENVKELPMAIRMAARLAPAIVFSEDIDRITDSERTHEVDMLLNTLDGIDTKQFPVMTILTSNYPERIYKGMVRPGRIDVALQIGPPDSEAAQRLVKTYLGDMFNDQNGDLEEMGNALAGHIPAVIREICERSKLSNISRTGKRPEAGSITADDVLRAAASMSNQIKLLSSKAEAVPPEVELVQRARALFTAQPEPALL